MSSLVAVILLAVGVGLVIAGAELFLDGLLAASGRLGVSAFAITVAISGFELENLAAGIAANASGLPGAAAGTFLGGTTFLALGVAGLAAVIAPIHARLPKAALAWTALAPLPLVALGLDGELSRLDGGLLVAWFAIALPGLIRVGRELLAPEEPERRRHPFAWLIGGLAVLTAGGELLSEGIRVVVERLGVSQTVLGNTVVAASVEAEEVARVAAPSRRGRGDLALGNVVGTIVHFAAFNAGVIAVIKPLELDAATRHLHLSRRAGRNARALRDTRAARRLGPTGGHLLPRPLRRLHRRSHRRRLSCRSGSHGGMAGSSNANTRTRPESRSQAKF